MDSYNQHVTAVSTNEIVRNLELMFYGTGNRFIAKAFSGENEEYSLIEVVDENGTEVSIRVDDIIAEADNAEQAAEMFCGKYAEVTKEQLRMPLKMFRDFCTETAAKATADISKKLHDLGVEGAAIFFSKDGYIQFSVYDINLTMTRTKEGEPFKITGEFTEELKGEF